MDMSADAKKINHFSMPQLVAEHIKERIYSGIYVSGDKLKEFALVDELNVSRGTIREALVKLQEINLVENIPRRGCFVVEPDAADIDTAFTLLLGVFSTDIIIDIKQVPIPSALLSVLDAYQETKAFDEALCDELLRLYGGVIHASGNKLIQRIAEPALCTLKRSSLPAHGVDVQRVRELVERIQQANLMGQKGGRFLFEVAKMQIEWIELYSK